MSASKSLQTRVMLLLATVAVHGIVLMSLVRPQERQTFRERQIRVEFLAASPPEPPIPTPAPKAQRTLSRSQAVVRTSPSPSPRETAPDTPMQPLTAEPELELFDRNGAAVVPKAAEHTDRLTREVAAGREIMGRGLNCAYAIENHESLGESTARKYLAWIGLYNPYKAERAVELEKNGRNGANDGRNESVASTEQEPPRRALPHKSSSNRFAEAINAKRKPAAPFDPQRSGSGLRP